VHDQTSGYNGYDWSPPDRGLLFVRWGHGVIREHHHWGLGCWVDSRQHIPKAIDIELRRIRVSSTRSGVNVYAAVRFDTSEAIGVDRRPMYSARISIGVVVGSTTNKPPPRNVMARSIRRRLRNRSALRLPT
jgi:hypothetical protein